MRIVEHGEIKATSNSCAELSERHVKQRFVDSDTIGMIPRIRKTYRRIRGRECEATKVNMTTPVRATNFSGSIL